MPDREKVYKGLECCSVLEGKCKECPYETEGYVAECTSALASDALALLKVQQDKIERLEDDKHTLKDVITKLKTQEAVEPFCWNDDYGQHWKCGHCGKVIGANDKYCHECGRPVKHNEQQRT